MNLNAIQERARVRLSDIDGNIASLKASLEQKLIERGRHVQFLTWLDLADAELMQDFAAETASVPAPVDDPKWLIDETAPVSSEEDVLTIEATPPPAQEDRSVAAPDRLAALRKTVTESEIEAVLIVLRANVDSEGVSWKTTTDLAQESGLGKDRVRLHVMPALRERGLTQGVNVDGRWGYRVQPKDGVPASLPVVETDKPSVSKDRLPRVSWSAALEARLLDHLRRAAGEDGLVLIERAFLVKKLETTELRLDDALVGLVSAGSAVRRKCDLKGHLTIELLPIAEAGQ